MIFDINKGIMPYWFIGRVVDNNDPLNAARVRVRCLGVHPDFPNNETNDKMEQDSVDDQDLHWAITINGTFGKIETIPEEGDWVFGFFADGRDAQHPYILGSINGQATDTSSALPYCAPGESPVGSSSGNGTPTPNVDPSEIIEGQILEFIANEEGFSPNAYEDYGQTSIGYGTRALPGETTITEAEARVRLAQEVSVARGSVLSANDRYGYGWNSNQIDALTSFTYNLGSGALTQLITADNTGVRTNAEIAEAMNLYINAGGSPLQGLIDRRARESALFLR